MGIKASMLHCFDVRLGDSEIEIIENKLRDSGIEVINNQNIFSRFCAYLQTRHVKNLENFNHFMQFWNFLDDFRKFEKKIESLRLTTQTTNIDCENVRENTKTFLSTASAINDKETPSEVYAANEDFNDFTDGQVYSEGNFESFGNFYNDKETCVLNRPDSVYEDLSTFRDDARVTSCRSEHTEHQRTSSDFEDRKNSREAVVRNSIAS